jgi:uncharacterized protein
MSHPTKANEPTMEEILASIRKIIADDETKPLPAPVKQSATPAAPAPKPAPAARAAPPVEAPRQPPAPAAVPHDDDIDAELAAFDAEMKDPSDGAADVLELTEAMRSRPPAFDAIAGHPDVVFDESRDSEDAQAAPPPLRAHAGGVEGPLLSSRTAAAVDTAFNSLAHTVLVQNSRTLEDLVREMLKPMLKGWLDDNLPKMVERLVRAEIERVSRGRG